MAVNGIDRFSGVVDVLMLKKAMEIQAQQASVVTETLSKMQESAAQVKAAPSPLGQRLDLRM